MIKKALVAATVVAISNVTCLAQIGTNWGDGGWGYGAPEPSGAVTLGLLGFALLVLRRKK